MSYDLAYYFALWRIGKLAPEEVPEVATNALVVGLDSPALRRLAGLNKPNSAETGGLFEDAMAEIGLNRISDEETESRLSDEWLQNAVAIARYTAYQIVNGQVDVAEGWLSLPYRDGELGPLAIFFTSADPGSSVDFNEEFRARIRSAAQQFVDSCSSSH